MTDHDDNSQGTLDDSVPTGEGSSSVETSVSSRVTACEKLVDKAVEKDSLKRLGLKAHKAVDYIEEFNQHVALRV